MNNFLLIEQSLPSIFKDCVGARAYFACCAYKAATTEKLIHLLGEGVMTSNWSPQTSVLCRRFNKGASNPKVEALKVALELETQPLYIDQLIVFEKPPVQEQLMFWQYLWREPAIESLNLMSWAEWCELRSQPEYIHQREDPSWNIVSADEIGLEFTPQEQQTLQAWANRQGRPWNRAELEVFAQSWSEHCKHKIFAARIDCVDTLQPHVDSLFKTFIRQPTLELMDKYPHRCLSVFHDNAGVLSLRTPEGQETEWAFCLKMETHNSPSAIAPYGGASTGIVGVHRDILGTGIGAKPIANWDVLCFESPQHQQARPPSALPADVVRKGVIKGIEEGGNQSGIPTVQGSIVFDPSYAVKPLVFAGTIGLLKKDHVNKRPAVGLALYCVGGETGIDGLRGAVMSSRDLREQDMLGSAVQVANAFVQRRLTDFLIVARDQGLIQVITDNGAGGLSSSVGEMAGLTGGAQIDLTHLRCKYQGLHGWERLLSESQERMTIATQAPEEFESLARDWQIPFDRLGVLNNSGYFHVTYHGRDLVNIPLTLLHEGCPQLHLSTPWTLAEENKLIKDQEVSLPILGSKVFLDFEIMLASYHGASREGVCRRFDHEVQGRTLKKPFSGDTQQSPADASLIEVDEAGAYVVLSHALQPWRRDIVEQTFFAFDECLRSALLSGARWDSAGLLDNFCWADPIASPQNPKADRRLWRLVRCCETLAQLCRLFELPLVSGKDSMKNNSRDFEVLDTLVISLGASAIAPYKVPASFFLRPNDVVLYSPPLFQSMADSMWERVMQGRFGGHRPRLFDGCTSTYEQSRRLEQLGQRLKQRYANLERAMATGYLRSAKDVGEGGLLMTLFELSLGRNLGLQLEKSPLEPDYWLAEGVGAFVLAVEPHHVEDICEILPDLHRLGVVVREPILRLADGQSYDLKKWNETYQRLNQERFWG